MHANLLEPGFHIRQANFSDPRHSSAAQRPYLAAGGPFPYPRAVPTSATGRSLPGSRHRTDAGFTFSGTVQEHGAHQVPADAVRLRLTMSATVLAQPNFAVDQTVASSLLNERNDLWREAIRFWPLSRLAAEFLAPRLRRGNAGFDAIMDQLAFELGISRGHRPQRDNSVPSTASI